MNQTKPKVIFLDAVGTLFGVKGSVGKIYQQIAENFGVKSDAKKLNSAFYDSFKEASPLAFSTINNQKVQDLEFDWWKEIAEQTFTIAEVRNQFTNFDNFFLDLYAYFSTKKPWQLYSDSIPSLKAWQKQGIELGLISNFDSRIYKVLQLLELRKYFLSITISSTTGFAKPNPKIFYTALEKHNCQLEDCWYIGDSLKEDYLGAKSLGIKSFLIQRN